MNIVKANGCRTRVCFLGDVPEGSAFRLETGEAPYMKIEGFTKDEMYRVVHLGTGRIYHYPTGKNVVLLDASVYVKGDLK